MKYTIEHRGTGWTLLDRGTAILRNLSRADAERMAADLNADEETQKAEAEYAAVAVEFRKAVEHSGTSSDAWSTWASALQNGADTCADLFVPSYDDWNRPTVAMMKHTLNTLRSLIDEGAPWTTTAKS